MLNAEQPDGKCVVLRDGLRPTKKRDSATLKSTHDAWETALRASRKRSHAKAASYWTSKISAASGDSRSMWRTVNNLLGEEKSTSVPAFSASDYHDCIGKKIADIRACTPSAADPT
jgi:hypothetical protein